MTRSDDRDQHDREGPDEDVGEGPAPKRSRSPRRSSGGIRLTGRIGYCSSARPKDRVWRTAEASSRCPSGVGLATLNACPRSRWRRSTRPGIARAGTADDDALDRDGALLGRVVVHRDAQLVREARRTVAKALARGAHVLRVALDRLDRLLEAHVVEPLARVLDGEAGGARPASGRCPRRRTAAMRVNRQELPRATARLVTSPRLQKSLAGAWFSTRRPPRPRVRAAIRSS